ncbi:Serine/threonine-protein kinase PknA [Roseimaritima multifibrata]|uniref:Serine/threonine-protein kinase PknA n=2 Tax=Roseimaritima multifibrata TaxID=1930274 RepID=A0A517MAS1_9BACT|nr:Serine/threonine-protein kinase PknA [Roseimaritima multifibrata]
MMGRYWVDIDGSGLGFDDEDDDGTELQENGDLDTDDGRNSSSGRTKSLPWKLGTEVRGFRLNKLLGRGATGAVYSATDLKTQSTLALKVLFHPDADTINRLKRGFRALAEIFHPNLVMLYGLYQHDGHSFITMEQIDGLPLVPAIRAEGIDSAAVFYDRINSILRDAGRALHALHSNQLVHRDIKPNNLLIDQTGRLRLIDYGMIGSFDPVWDPEGHRAYVAGNRKYMAPEVLTKQNYPPGSDMFSLGRVLVKLIRSCHPFRHGLHMSSDGLLPVDTPKPLARLIRRMLKVEISERPTAWEIASTAADSSEATSSLLVNPWQLRIVGREKSIQEVREWLSLMVAGKARRLHVTASPGIGKTRFLNAIREQLKEHAWLQVFASQCRSREEVPLQAFDEMVDVLARRYSGPNAEQLELDPVSTQILHYSFPVLRGVLKKANEVSRDRSLGQAEANDAAIHLTSQVCRHGPVILIIDDLQWADQDSLALIRRLEKEVHGLFAVITASRDDFIPPDLSPEFVLRLDPLTETESKEVLRRHLQLSRIVLTDSIIQQVVQMANGNCHHLLQLAAGMSAAKPNELAAWSNNTSLDIRCLWRHRLERLSEPARGLLTHIAAAGGPVDIALAMKITNLGEAGREVLSQLLQQQWLSKRTSTHHVEIFHDTILEALSDILPAEQWQQAHLQWAERLIEEGESVSAARIAGHLFQANLPEKGAEYAIRAADEAETRYAFYEAGRWHYRASQHLLPEPAFEQLKKSADAYTAGERSTEAGQIYLEMAEHPQAENPAWCQAAAAESFIRAGNIEQALSIIVDLAVRLGLPTPKSNWRSNLSIICNRLRLRWRGGYRLPAASDSSAVDATEDPLINERVRICFQVTRALAFYENHYAANLITAGLLKIHLPDGSPARLRGAVAYAVLGSYNPGWWRRSAARLLTEMDARVEEDENVDAIAHTAAARGYHYWLQASYADCIFSLEKASTLYRQQCRGMVFESVHTQFPVLTAYFFLGRIDQLMLVAQSMQHDALDRDDQFTLDTATTGFSATAALFNGDVAWVKKRSQLPKARRHDPQWQFLDVLKHVALILRKMYIGRPDHAEKIIKLYRGQLKKSGILRMQAGRIWDSWLQGTVGLQLAVANPEQSWERLNTVSRKARLLIREDVPFAVVVGQLMLARIAEMKGQTDQAKELYTAAAKGADQQQLEPFRRIALDGLEYRPGRRSRPSRLHELLEEMRVQDPVASLRLYTAPRPTKDARPDQ